MVGVIVVAIVLLGTAVIITRTTESYLIDRVDEQLLAQADGGPREGPGGPWRFDDENEFHGVSSLYMGVLDDGTVRTELLSNLTGENLPPPDVSAEDAFEALEEDEGPFTTDTESDAELRYRVLVVSDRFQDEIHVLGLPLNEVDATMVRLIRVEIVATAVIVAILALVTYWVIRLGVRPIKQMTSTASAIAGGELSHRVPDVVVGTEAGELGVALNQMLGRIETAFAERTRSENRLRQFVADASHELRTPVTTIRGYAELFRAGGLDDAGELEQAMCRTEQEAVRMGALVEDLLLLAHLDQGRPLERSTVDLGVLSIDGVSDARAVDPDRPISASIDEGVTVAGDEGRLRQVVGNLIGNALVHTAPGTPVEVRVHRNGARGVLEVRDHGPGMSDEVAAQAFDRFYRADPARSRHRGGSGLGLAIVKATVNAHGGNVELTTAPGEGTTVRVVLPT
ncbi:MAG: sensor histidine kinase [Acidimicrobiales bacterium]